MIKPFYQGKLDTFCAIYAVLNALRLIQGLRTLKARDILNSTLLSLGTHPAAFQAFLNQKTDYIDFVDSLLSDLKNTCHLEIITPYTKNERISAQKFWDDCKNWLGSETVATGRKTIIFRFLRYLDPDKPPLNKHWTTVEYVKDDIMHLFDSSHEAEAILNIRKNSFATFSKDIEKSRLLLISPESVRFIRLAV